MTVNELETGFRKLMKELYSKNLVRSRKEQFISLTKEVSKTSNRVAEKK